MGVVGRLDQYASMLATEFDEISVNKFSISVGGTCYSNEFVENVDIPYISNIYPAYNIVDGLFAEVSSGIGLSYPNPTLSANVFAPYDPVSGEFASVSYGPGQGTFMRRDYLGDLIVYNEIDEVSDFRDIVRSGLVLDLDAGMNSSFNNTGTTWTDLSGNGNTGTLVNGVGYSASNGGTLTFDGSNDYVEVTNDTGFGEVSTTPTTTLEIWANVTRKPGGGQQYQQLAGFRNDTNFDMFFLLLDLSGATVNTEARFRTSSGFWDINVDYPYFNTWTHIVFVANVNRTDLYFNGNLVGSNTNIVGSMGATSGNFRVGSSPADAWHILGNISSTKVYNRALTAAEIQQNYNALKHRFGL